MHPWDNEVMQRVEFKPSCSSAPQSPFEYTATMFPDSPSGPYLGPDDPSIEYADGISEPSRWDTTEKNHLVENSTPAHSVEHTRPKPEQLSVRKLNTTAFSLPSPFSGNFSKPKRAPWNRRKSEFYIQSKKMEKKARDQQTFR